MFIRLLLLILLLVAGWFLVHKWRGHPMLRIPREWRQKAKDYRAFRRALEVRQRLAEILVSGRAQQSKLLLAEVDSVVATMSSTLDHRSRLLQTGSLLNKSGADWSSIQKRIQDLDCDLKKSREALQDALTHLARVAEGEDSYQTDLVLENLKSRMVGFDATLEVVEDHADFVYSE